MPDWQAFVLDGDMFWTVLVVGVLILLILGLMRYAGYFDKDDDLTDLTD